MIQLSLLDKSLPAHRPIEWKRDRCVTSRTPRPIVPLYCSALSLARSAQAERDNELSVHEAVDPSLCSGRHTPCGRRPSDRSHWELASEGSISAVDAKAYPIGAILEPVRAWCHRYPISVAARFPIRSGVDSRVPLAAFLKVKRAYEPPDSGRSPPSMDCHPREVVLCWPLESK
ncbi:hypothetical protein EVAR_49711_1 [Eumeta japonica]|uniref:Uncharacterized protein n=1 Tax=Eumeta variegata TaxID=151549 RepID=A0A4C1Z0Y8_EUMVA|nr:hypothetical protein EVAR_49711_1 [Eumeta japonica]